MWPNCIHFNRWEACLQSSRIKWLNRNHAIMWPNCIHRVDCWYIVWDIISVVFPVTWWPDQSSVYQWENCIETMCKLRIKTTPGTLMWVRISLQLIPFPRAAAPDSGILLALRSKSTNVLLCIRACAIALAPSGPNPFILSLRTFKLTFSWNSK